MFLSPFMKDFKIAFFITHYTISDDQVCMKYNQNSGFGDHLPYNTL